MRVLRFAQRGGLSIVNGASTTEYARSVAPDWPGPQGLIANFGPLIGCEGVAFVLERRRGSYFFIGSGWSQSGCMTHSAHYDFNFNDAILSIGAVCRSRLVEAAPDAGSG